MRRLRRWIDSLPPTVFNLGMPVIGSSGWMLILAGHVAMGCALLSAVLAFALVVAVVLYLDR